MKNALREATTAANLAEITLAGTRHRLEGIPGLYLDANEKGKEALARELAEQTAREHLELVTLRELRRREGVALVAIAEAAVEEAKQELADAVRAGADLRKQVEVAQSETRVAHNNPTRIFTPDMGRDDIQQWLVEKGTSLEGMRQRLRVIVVPRITRAREYLDRAELALAEARAEAARLIDF